MRYPRVNEIVLVDNRPVRISVVDGRNGLSLAGTEKGFLYAFYLDARVGSHEDKDWILQFLGSMVVLDMDKDLHRITYLSPEERALITLGL